MEISYKVEGLRSIRSMPFVELKPITILVGLNNSGKSTFLRSLPLIKQSVESKYNKPPILWQGTVDFGDFKSSVSKKLKKYNEKKYPIKENIENNTTDIKFSFNFTDVNIGLISKIIMGYFFRFLVDEVLAEKNETMKVEYEISLTNFKADETGNEYAVFKNVSIVVPELDLNMQLEFSIDGSTIRSVKINDTELTEYFSLEKLRPNGNSIFFDNLDFSFKILKYNLTNGLDGFFNYIEAILYNDSMSMKRHADYEKIFSAKFNRLVKKIKKIIDKDVIFSKSLVRNNDNSEEVWNEFTKKEKEYLLNLGKYYLLFDVLFHVNKILIDFTSGLNYLAPARTKTERFVPLTEFGVDDIDSQGKNLPLFVNSLDVVQKDKFADWLIEFFDFKVGVRKIEGHVVMEIDYFGESLNIADVGYGVSQVLPVLAQVWWAKNKPDTKKNSLSNFSYPFRRTVVMEQPELHLHPQQQANLANAIGSVVSDQTGNELPSPRFIIETHSEEIVAKFSDLIFRGVIKHTDVQVVMFNVKPDCAPLNSDIHICNFLKNGELENWPYGFFDSRY